MAMHSIPDTKCVVRNPTQTIIRCNADEIMVRWGSRSRTSHQLKDDHNRGVLADLVERLALPADIAQISAWYPHVDPVHIEEILDSLLRHHVVVELAQAEGAFLELGLQLGSRSLLAQCSVGVVGDGAIARAVINDLADAGVGSFAVLDIRRALRDHGAALVTGEAEIEWLDSDGDAELADLFGEADVVCVAGDEPDLAMLYRCNALALESQTPWLMAHADGPEIIVGPLFRPYETACFNDYDTQEEAARTHRMDHLFYKAALVRDGFERRPIPRFMAEQAGSMATLALVQALTGGASFLEGAVLRTDLERMEVVREMVLRMPRCPACIGGRPDYRHPFL